MRLQTIVIHRTRLHFNKEEMVLVNGFHITWRFPYTFIEGGSVKAFVWSVKMIMATMHTSCIYIYTQKKTKTTTLRLTVPYNLLSLHGYIVISSYFSSILPVLMHNMSAVYKWTYIQHVYTYLLIRTSILYKLLSWRDRGDL